MDPSGVSMRALERAVAVVNRIITRSTVQKDNKVTTDTKSKGKWTKISAKAWGHTAVQEVERQEKGLAQYLALPVEEYSLLDPSWITREPGSNVFCLSAPVKGITGVDLEPKVWVTVDVNAEKGTVNFHSDRACTGDPSMDERLKLSFEGKLWHKPAKPRRAQRKHMPSKASGRRRHSPDASVDSSSMLDVPHGSSAAIEASEASQRSAETADVAVGATGFAAGSLQQSMCISAAASGSTSAEHGPYVNGNPPGGEQSLVAVSANGAGPAAPQQTSESPVLHGSSTLHADARVWASVRLGPPLNVVPGFLISYTGGLIATAVLQALMPSVLELLSRDYQTWAAKGQREFLRSTEEGIVSEDAVVSASELVHS